MPRYIEMSPGEKYGRLTVKEYVGNNKHRSAMWKCLCDCGKEIIVKGCQLRSGKTKSCGCFQKELASQNVMNYNKSTQYKPPSHTIHGLRHTRIYQTWCRMKQRCNNQNSDNYKYYGGRGIKVCDEWNENFVSFYDWSMCHGYSDDLTIDRIDVNKGYNPDNCRWITQKEQMMNRRETVRLEYQGVIKTLKEWCKQYDFNYKLAHARYKKGWEFERIFKPL